MNGYFVVGVTTIGYPGFKTMMMIIISKEDKSYYVTIGDIP